MILIHIFKYAPCVKSYTFHILPGEVGGHSLFPWCRHWQVVKAKNDCSKDLNDGGENNDVDGVGEDNDVDNNCRDEAARSGGGGGAAATADSM